MEINYTYLVLAVELIFLVLLVKDHYDFKERLKKYIKDSDSDKRNFHTRILECEYAPKFRKDDLVVCFLQKTRHEHRIVPKAVKGRIVSSRLYQQGYGYGYYRNYEVITDGFLVEWVEEKHIKLYNELEHDYLETGPGNRQA